MNIKSVDMAERTEQLKNLRWGMFVCWSFSTFSGKEWTAGVMETNFFAAKDCDTDQWACIAKEAGMGYILFLAKHHDGFCLWDTQTTDRKVTKAPLGRDVLAELRKSCDSHGLKLALYFSEGDWTWPGAKDGAAGGSGQDAAKERQQLAELLTNYGPIEYMWIDHAAGTGGLSHPEFLAHCKALQPGCLVGFNHGDQTGVQIRLGEEGRPGPLSDTKASGPHMTNAPSKDYLLAEFTYPILPRHKGGAMWFYSLPEHDALCHPAEKLYADYLGAVKYGNIFSIDVGPDYNGKLRAIDVKTLRQVGEMIKKASEKHAVYRQTIQAIEALVEGETDPIAVMSTVACELYHAFDYFNWVGFYRRINPDTLKVGPYQGTHGCLTINIQRGVCGACVRAATVQIENDVSKAADYIACSAETKAEIVLPIFDHSGAVIAVLDIDSSAADVFDEVDVICLERICKHLAFTAGHGAGLEGKVKDAL